MFRFRQARMLCREDKYLQVIAHMYRGEMNRLTIYRQRLDIISTWAISLLTAFIIFYVSNPDQPPVTVFVCILPVFIFSLIEARRYRYYRLAHHRIRLLEVGFYVEEVLTNALGIQSRISLIDSLRNPQFPLTFAKSWLIRVHRNYIWMFDLIGAAWIIKAEGHTFISLILGLVLVGTHAVLFWLVCNDPADT